jgi:hypothetical protein
MERRARVPHILPRAKDIEAELGVSRVVLDSDRFRRATPLPKAKGGVKSEGIVKT